MKRSIIVVVILAAVGGGTWYLKRGGTDANAASSTSNGNQGRGGRQGGGGPGGFGGSGFGGTREPMTVAAAAVKRAIMAQSMEVVGNLIGARTVEAVPKVAGRLEEV